MRIEKNNTAITSIIQWEQHAGPIRKNQWKDGRSAKELARAWCGDHAPTMPAVLRSLLDSRAETSGLEVNTVYPDYSISFDAHAGKPLSVDLAFVGHSASGLVAVTVQAKADESFGHTVEKSLGSALERRIANPRSNGIRRIEDLACALFGSKQDNVPHVGNLRYQLLTAAAGTLAYALAQKPVAAVCVLVIHEFVTDQTSDAMHARTAKDYRQFLHRLSGRPFGDAELHGLLGPFRVPGMPLFERVPDLLIGKITTNIRSVQN